ncbi:MAG: mprA 3 [Firmicutes bacterium]|nr:mprA 3 [Bacillota bacterium]
MKLLLVEDSCRLLDALAHILKKHGYIVDTASDGEIGCDLATTNHYDVLVLDRMLPKKDGLSIIKEVRNRNITTPILLVSARDSTNDQSDGLSAGADDYLIKPFTTDELLARLRKLIHSPPQVQ